jgi:hypothetical protein
MVLFTAIRTGPMSTSSTPFLIRRQLTSRIREFFFGPGGHGAKDSETSYRTGLQGIKLANIPILLDY